ncbi:MAG: OmpA family protein [Candidatus Omnitrophica bacterium]|nr:OmpA family protein [Candidatus Omnitrophota bacterium]
MKFVKNVIILSIMAIFVAGLSGCTVVIQNGRTKDIQQISDLKRSLSELERAKEQLEQQLKREINDREVSIQMLEKGLVITFVSEVLFDSGKANLKNDSLGKLNKGIEGHTDNVPIKHSGWKSNWELSSARAMSVLHYLVDKQGIDPTRVSGTGYGEFHPVASNDTKDGRQKNRRVEIVILPNTVKDKALESESAYPADEEENLK